MFQDRIGCQVELGWIWVGRKNQVVEGWIMVGSDISSSVRIVSGLDWIYQVKEGWINLGRICQVE